MMALLDTIEIDVGTPGDLLTVYLDVYDNSLSRKWLPALNQVIANGYHLEKNYCWLGWPSSPRTVEYLCDQINSSIQAINQAQLGYTIQDEFTRANTIHTGAVGDGLPGHCLIKHRFNQLHRYFEDLQGVSGMLSPYYLAANSETRWHIRQLNLLCHEYECLVQSQRKLQHAPDWQRPSQLMCWLGSPRFALDAEDLELFGVDTISRAQGGVYVGVNKAVGKHHWEVFQDEGRDSRIDELTTTTLRGQSEAAGDFDIEWAQDPSTGPWMQTKLAEFRSWLRINGFDPEDPALTIGHPQVGQTDLIRSFGTDNHKEIWHKLESRLNIWAIRTGSQEQVYEYSWTDYNYSQQQIQALDQ
jgi:hypothetical protein